MNMTFNKVDFIFTVTQTLHPFPAITLYVPFHLFCFCLFSGVKKQTCHLSLLALAISFSDRTLQLRSLPGLVCGVQDLLYTKCTKEKCNL